MPLAIPAAMTKKARRRQRGTSFLEVMLSMSVMAASLLSLVSVVTFSIRGKERQRELETAHETAAAIHETLKAQTTGLSPVGQSIQDHLRSSCGAPKTQTIGGRSYQVTTLPIPGLAWPRWTPSSKKPSTQGMGTITVDTSNSQLVAVTVQIDWKSYGRNTRYSLRNLYATGYFK